MKLPNRYSWSNLANTPSSTKPSSKPTKTSHHSFELFKKAAKEKEERVRMFIMRRAIPYYWSLPLCSTLNLKGEVHLDINLIEAETWEEQFIESLSKFQLKIRKLHSFEVAINQTQIDNSVTYLAKSPPILPCTNKLKRL